MVMKLSEQDRLRIHAAVKEAEARTHARFASVVVRACDRYTLYPPLWGAIVALMAGACLALARPELSLRMGVLIAAAAFAAFALIFDWFPLRLLLVPKRAKHEHARNLAHREFAARILAPGGDGILFFVSLGERYVEILASREVHAKVGDTAWNAIVADFTASAKAGRIADGAIAAIQACAGHLAAHFPKA
jgi:putative membrane protein